MWAFIVPLGLISCIVITGNQPFANSHSLRSDSKHAIDSVAPLLIDNGDIVTIRFSSSKPSQYDWIGAHSPPDAELSQSFPVI